MARVLVVDDSATIRRVVSRTLTNAGFDVVVAPDGRAALACAQLEVPDLVLVDFVMPQMNGLKFVQALRGIANLRNVPVVLMSAKADKIGEGFVAQTGAIDAIAKPFSPDALLTMTEHALSKAKDTEAPDLLTVHARPAPPPSAPPGEDVPAETTSGILADARGHIAQQIAEMVAGVLPDVAPDALCEALEARFAPAELFEEVEGLNAMVPGRDGQVALRGRLEHVSLGEVLQMLTHSRHTGVLDIEKHASRSGRAVSVCFNRGKVQLALGRVREQEFRLGHYLVREALVEQSTLDRFVAGRSNRPGLLGIQLVKQKHISAENLQRALVQQTSELIYEALRWSRGEFRFVRFASRPEARDANLELSVAAILMEGLRRVDEWRLIEEQVRSFDDIPRRDEEALRAIDRNRLSQDERRTLDGIDGQKSIREIIDAGQHSSFETCRVLFQLATSRLIHLQPPGDAGDE